MKARSAALIFGATCILGWAASPAFAGLKICNNTKAKVNIAIGYKDKQGWASEGWWTAAPSQCQTLLKGDLIARYYYIYAVDSNRGSWGGKAQLCVQDKAFTIRGIENCAQRTYGQKGFFEVDTNEEKDWTINLTGEPLTSQEK